MVRINVCRADPNIWKSGRVTPRAPQKGVIGYYLHFNCQFTHNHPALTPTLHHFSGSAIDLRTSTSVLFVLQIATIFNTPF